MSGDERVVVTGVGYVTALGFNDADHEPALRDGRSTARPITRFDTAGLKTTLGGQCDEARLERLLQDRFSTQSLRGLGVDTRLVLWAAASALDGAGVKRPTVDGSLPTILGTTLEGFWQAEQCRGGRFYSRVFPHCALASIISSLAASRYYSDRLLD